MSDEQPQMDSSYPAAPDMPVAGHQPEHAAPDADGGGDAPPDVTHHHDPGTPEQYAGRPLLDPWDEDAAEATGVWRGSNG